MNIIKIKERVNRRGALIAKLLELQKIDLDSIGESDPLPLTKDKILKAVLKCNRRDFDSVFWKHKASGKVNQKRKNVKIRQMYFYLSKELTDSSLKEIGRVKREGKIYNIFDHSTVIHGVRAHEDIIETYRSEKKLHDSVVKYLQL